MIGVAVAGCEIGFWVLLGFGLLARYVLHRRRLGMALLVVTPSVDVALLVVTAIDLHRGATAGTAHALAAVYLGFSVAYGHKLIGWADARAAHRFAGGPAPRRRYGADYARACWGDVGRTAVAVSVAAVVLAALILLAGDGDRTEVLVAYYPILGIIAAVDLIWAISYTIWPKRPAKT